MPKVSEMLGISDDWRPGKFDCARLYITAQGNRWTREGVHNLIYAQFKKSSTKELTYSEFEKVMNWLVTIPENTTTVERDPNTLDMFNDNLPPV